MGATDTRHFDVDSTGKHSSRNNSNFSSIYFTSHNMLYTALLLCVLVTLGHCQHDHGHAHHDGHGHVHNGGHGHAHHGGHGHAHHGGHGHAHNGGHGHDDMSEAENVNFRYSREANQVPHSHSSDPHSHHSHFDNTKQTKEEAQHEPRQVMKPMLWLQAIAATVAISAAPVLILLFIPLENTKENLPFLKILLSFASGGLLGDAFLHLIPHAASQNSHPSEHQHGHSHDAGHNHDLSSGLWVLSGIIVFLSVEKTVRYLKGSHGHSHTPPPAKKTSDDEDKKKKDKVKNAPSKGKSPAQTDIAVSGYLNLAADFAHNFTDGLAIGASFLVGRNVGIVTTITIFLHEIPHEIGDFAILVKSGCTKKRAMMLQFTTAIGAILGTICSLVAGTTGIAATAWVLPFTAGGFIYIATVSVIPELLLESTFRQSIKEIVALILGVYMMVLIASYE
ncbi:hypothetical protein Ahia01_001025500 [Argonauta hians]